MDEKKRTVYLVGIGMGSVSGLTLEGLKIIQSADALMGAQRMLACIQEFVGEKPVCITYKPEEMAAWLSGFCWEKAVLVLSGDTGFYSGASAAAHCFAAAGWACVWVPGVSSLSYFCARLGRSWQDVHTVSAHGREADLKAHVDRFACCFVLPASPGGVHALCMQLKEGDCSHLTLWAGERLSYPDERVIRAVSVDELLIEDAKKPFGSLSCVLIENRDAAEKALYPCLSPGDGAFIRSRVPMTKETVRFLVTAKLCLGAAAVCWDIGSGTGAVSVEIGRILRAGLGSGCLVAIEKRPDAAALTKANMEKLLPGWKGFTLIEGEAPEVFDGLPAPTHAFIGGSGGRFGEIVETLLEKNPFVRIVASAVTLETLGDILSCIKRFGFRERSIMQVLAASAGEVGAYHLLKSENPVFLAVLQYPSTVCKEA